MLLRCAGFDRQVASCAMQDVFKHIDAILAMDKPTLAVIACLCVVAAYFLRDFMANPVLIVFVYPVLFVCSVLFQYGIILMEVYPPQKMDLWLMWTVFGCIAGNITGIAITAGLGRLIDRVRVVQAYKPAQG
jgi:hypothetical protein